MLLSLYIIAMFLQSVTVYLDNKSSMFVFFEEVIGGRVANAYTKRGILLTLSRTLFFTIPPILGLITIRTEVSTLLNLCLMAAVINLFLTLWQGMFYNKLYINEIFSFHVHKALFRSGTFILGVLAFIFFLITPYLLNILAMYYPQNALWIVQLNNILNSIFIFYLIFIFEPQVSKKIDNGADIKLFRYHAFLARLYGRLILIITLCIYFVMFNKAIYL